MDIDRELQFIRQLSYEWAKLDLPTKALSYGDYVRSIAGLQEAIKNEELTRRIVEAVLSQAKTLGRSSEWVERELRFEALAAYVQNRSELLALDLEHGGVVTDAALDLYNERLNRFDSNG